MLKSVNPRLLTATMLLLLLSSATAGAQTQRSKQGRLINRINTRTNPQSSTTSRPGSNEANTSDRPGSNGDNTNDRPGSSNSSSGDRPGSGTSGGTLSNITNADAGAALREALTIGARNAGSKLNVTNGFFGNALIKVLMPPEARQVEQTLRSFGFGSLVDKTVLSMNRAAEDAAIKAVPIFVDAIRGITIQDGLQILRGGSGAATSFLRTRTTGALTNAFRPVIQNSLGKVGATALWGDVFSTYNKLPLGQKVNPDLTGYVTERALNGLFVTIAEEENKIRTNPAAQVTNLLQQVFGAIGGR